MLFSAMGSFILPNAPFIVKKIVIMQTQCHHPPQPANAACHQTQKMSQEQT